MNLFVWWKAPCCICGKIGLFSSTSTVRSICNPMNRHIYLHNCSQRSWMRLPLLLFFLLTMTTTIMMMMMMMIIIIIISMITHICIYQKITAQDFIFQLQFTTCVSNNARTNMIASCQWEKLLIENYIFGFYQNYHHWKNDFGPAIHYMQWQSVTWWTRPWNAVWKKSDRYRKFTFINSDFCVENVSSNTCREFQGFTNTHTRMRAHKLSRRHIRIMWPEIAGKASDYLRACLS